MSIREKAYIAVKYLRLDTARNPSNPVLYMLFSHLFTTLLQLFQSHRKPLSAFQVDSAHFTQLAGIFLKHVLNFQREIESCRKAAGRAVPNTNTHQVIVEEKTMKKRFLAVSMACITAFTLLSGCSEKHIHQSSELWKTDLNNHWKFCADCGQKTEESEHTLDDSNTCTTCGAEIIEWDSSTSLYQFNESGDPLKTAEYDADGFVLTETIYTYEYDADGNLTHSVTTTDGVITEDNTYCTVDGETVPSQCIIYLDDGSKGISEYDAHGNAIHLLYYDANGNLYSQAEYEYALSADGQWYEVKCTDTEEDNSKIVSEYSENGDQTSAVRYDADGNLVYSYAWQYTYDENGNWNTLQYYCNGVLTSDTIYATAATEDGSMTYPETVTEYEEDGKKTVTVYDENENILHQIHYDTNGSVIS